MGYILNLMYIFIPERVHNGKRKQHIIPVYKGKAKTSLAYTTRAGRESGGGPALCQRPGAGESHAEDGQGKPAAQTFWS